MIRITKYIIVVAIILSLFACKKDNDIDDENESVKKETVVLPNEVFQKQGQQTFSFKEVEGKVLLLDFWAQWCAPCKEQHPKIVKLDSSINNTNFVVINISVERNKEDWETFIDTTNWGGVNIYVGNTQENLLYKYVSPNNPSLTTIPQYFLIDKSLNIEKIDIETPNLKTKIEQLLNN